MPAFRAGIENLKNGLPNGATIYQRVARMPHLRYIWIPASAGMTRSGAKQLLSFSGVTGESMFFVSATRRYVLAIVDIRTLYEVAKDKKLLGIIDCEVLWATTLSRETWNIGPFRAYQR